MTADDGSYAWPALPVGIYTILVQKPGYEDLIEEGLTIADDGETVPRNFRLQPAAAETVQGVEELNPKCRKCGS